ncbi:preprotein translocase subunit SecG [Rubellimicrobium aerolatum]|uniref:Protein-export membrane protein SecG n=1 Tax=Rubellimicrobium aerolatum TaxID=490979 RepID=A0ABW0SDH1_9RHOB|nr:preprotein translocase subunit SecG [Rubellimicrobium aerolatum]MBP1805781.1 preprotein translocase subunit SecG [Rubellimicrobium aerolatum]
METVALVILLILAVALIGVVLLQRSEGGGLGMGGGGVMTGRAAATALGRATWIIGGAFMAMSVVLTILAAERSAGSSVVDQINARGSAATEDEDAAPALPGGLGGGDLLPPPAGGAATDAPLVPSGD